MFHCLAAVIGVTLPTGRADRQNGLRRNGIEENRAGARLTTGSARQWSWVWEDQVRPLMVSPRAGSHRGVQPAAPACGNSQPAAPACGNGDGAGIGTAGPRHVREEHGDAMRANPPRRRRVFVPAFLYFAAIQAFAVSDIRLEKPHSLSYHAMIRTMVPSITCVCVPSKVELCAS